MSPPGRPGRPGSPGAPRSVAFVPPSASCYGPRRRRRGVAAPGRKKVAEMLVKHGETIGKP